MKITVFGKNGGTFKGADGREVRFYKISCVTNVKQSDGDYIVCGYASEKLKVDRSIFDSLPDDKDSYTNGIVCDAEFDFKGNIINLDYA